MLLSTTALIAHILIFFGFYGALTRRDNLVITLINLEVTLLGVALFFLTTSAAIGDAQGGLMFFLLLTLAAVESAIGLALVISYYRMKTGVSWSQLSASRG